MTAGLAAWTSRHEQLERLRTERPRISGAEIDEIVERLHGAGIPALVEPWVHRTVGRHRTLPATTLLAGMFLGAGRASGRVTLTAVTDLLNFQISPAKRRALGITAKPDTDKGFEAAYAVVRRLFPAPVTTGSRKRRQRADYKFGYEATLVIAHTPSQQGSAGPGMPALVMGFVLDVPGRTP